MFFPHLYSYFLASNFYFSSRGALPFTRFIYCLPRDSRMSILYEFQNILV